MTDQPELRLVRELVAGQLDSTEFVREIGRATKRPALVIRPVSGVEESGA